MQSAKCAMSGVGFGSGGGQVPAHLKESSHKEWERFSYFSSIARFILKEKFWGD